MNTTPTNGRHDRSGRTYQTADRHSIRWDRRFVRLVAPPAIALLALAACSGTKSSSATTSPETGEPSDANETTSVAEVDCDFAAFDQLSVAPPTCYTITVPEDWSNPVPGDSVVIRAAVFHATNPDQTAKDPVIYLQGGPGISTFGTLKFFEPIVVKPFLATRDVILFDQRGTGQSTPNLECAAEDETLSASDSDSSEVASPADTIEADGTIPSDEGDQDDQSDDSDQGDDSDDNADELFYEAMLKEAAECHRQLTNDGVNLTAYNSVASAHDIDAIRAGLGYDKVNVVGVSYGTRLAQTYMRMFPDSIRSVVIDSVLPVAQPMFESKPVVLQNVIQNLFDRCRADAGCNAAYPNFEADFFALVDRLNDEPAEFEETTPDGFVMTQVIDGNELFNVVSNNLYDKETLARLPAMVTEALAGNIEILGQMSGPDDSAESSELEETSIPVWNSVFCNERVPFESAEQMVANVPTEGEFSRLADYAQQRDTMFETCAVWPAGQAPAVENEPVVSEIPTLLLTGSFDPVTPPAFARSAAEHLANSTVVEFPSEGHGVLRVECGRDLARAFIDDPSQVPDTACVEAVSPPQWVQQ